MAVSGRKLSDFQDSLSRGSAEDFEHCCDSCLSEGHNVESNRYCMDCCEYLCNSCVRYHKKTKVTRYHQLLDKDNMDKHSTLIACSNVCTEKCSIHKNEIITYFCPKHEEIGCTDCMTMNHGTCKPDNIPDTCAGIADSDEFREIVKELDLKINEADVVLKKAAVKDKEIDDCHDRVIKDIFEKRKEINDHLDTIQKKTEEDANKKKATGKQEVKAVVTSCRSFTTNIIKLQSNLQNSKTTKQNSQLFTDIKRAKAELQLGDIQQAEMLLRKTSGQFTLIRNKDLENMLSVESFGKLTESAAVDIPSNVLQILPTMPRRKAPFNSLQLKLDIKLNKACNITGCVSLSSDKLVLADYSDTNTRLLVANTENNVVIEKKKLDSAPWDITILPHDQIAVTVPGERQIIIMTTAGRLETDNSIDVDSVCKGIVCKQNCLYVLCWYPCCVRVLDIKGNIKSVISLADKDVFHSPNYIALSEDQSLLYVSDCGSHSVICVTLKGEVSSVYKHVDLKGPMEMSVFGDGSLLVCCYDNCTIHHVSADLKQGMKVMYGLSHPWSICYNSDRDEVYIGGFGGDNLMVCSVIYKM